MILWHVVAFWGVMAMPNRFFSLVAKCLVAFSLVIGPSQALAFSTAKHQLPTTIEGKGDFPTTYVVAPDSDGRGSALYRVDHATASLLASFPDFDFNVAHSDAIVSHDQKNVAVIVSDGPHSALYRVSADGQYITSIYAGGKLDLLASESTKPVPVVTSAAWSPSGDLLYTLVTWPDDEAATVAEKAGKPLPFVGDVWLFESATGQQKRIAQGSYYRVLGLDSEGSKLAVTTLVPFVEDWRSENIAVVDLKAPAAQPVWITEKVGTPDYFAIESVPLADGSLLVSTVFASAMPGTTTFSLDSQALVIDPFTGSTGELAVASNAQASGGDKSLLSTWVDVNPHDFTSSSDQTSGVVYQSGPGIFLLEKGSSQAVLSLSTPDNQGKLVAWGKQGFVLWDSDARVLSLLDATGTKMGVLNFPGTPSWKGPLPIPGAATLDAISVNVDATSETVTSEPPFSSDNQLEGIAATGLNPGELEVVDFPVDYVNQLADTRDGWKGHASCGPTSALMLMAYYHRLRPHSMQVNGTTYVVNGQVVNYPEKLPAHATNYGWYITEPYNFQSLAYDSLYDFSVYQPNATIAGQNTVGQSAAGAWASITQGSGITAINPLRDYLAMHDLGYKYQGSPSFDWIKSELDSGGIVLLGTWQTSAGHIIVARGYTTSNRVIVNDPYGSWLSAGNFNICGSSQEPSLACGADRVYTPSAINIAWALAVYPPRFSPMFYANESGVGTALQVENSTATIPGTNNWAGVYFPNYLGSRVQFTHYIAFAPFDSKSITSPSVGSLENGAMLLPWSGGFVAATKRRPVTSAPYSDGAAAAISSARASAVWYLPLVSSHKSTASGENNSTLQVMNVSGMDDTVRFQFFDTGGNLAVDTYQGIPARASLSWEIYGLGVPWNWIGSAQVSSVNGGQFVVGFETTTGNSGRHVSVGTPSERGSTNWGVPQFLSRLTNATGVPISTPLNIQNISGSTMAAGSIQFVCTKTSGSSTQTTINRSNPSPVANLTLFGVNPVTDGTIPAEWAGYCTVTAPGKVLVAIQQRYVGATYLGATGTYEGLPRGVNRNINQRRLLFPDVWRRVSKPNNQMLASSLIIQNVDTANVQVVIYYMASSTCGSSTSTNYSYGPFTLAPGESRNRNMRLYNSGSSEEATELPLGWCGSVIVGASGAVDGFVQQTDTNNPSGDWLSVYNAIILP